MKSCRLFLCAATERFCERAKLMRKNGKKCAQKMKQRVSHKSASIEVFYDLFFGAALPRLVGRRENVKSRLRATAINSSFVQPEHIIFGFFHC